MPRFELRPFHPAEAELISHWAANADDLWKLAGSRDWPLTPDQVTAWVFETNFTFTLRYEGDLVAYGEIVEDEVAADVEIQHVVVAPDMRSQGIGKALVSRLCAFLAASRPYNEVWARVGRDNSSAARCFSAVGFVEDPSHSGDIYLWFKKPLQLSSEHQEEEEA
jgi:RimJ/RimL family protein N-acetyltransferase